MADRHTTIRASQFRNLSLTGEDIANTSISGSTKLIDSSVTESKLDIFNNPIDGYYLKYTTASGMEWAVSGGGSSDHGSLTGLTDDDHSQYLLTNGNRQLTGGWDYGSQTISGSGNIYTSGDIHIGDVVLANKQNIDIDIGTETVDYFADTSGDGCVWHFVVKSGVNLRAGEVVACWESVSDVVEYTETSTNDIGDTTDLTLSVDVDSNNIRLRATASSDNWQVKTMRMLL
jgi:hypothetical protein